MTKNSNNCSNKRGYQPSKKNVQSGYQPTQTPNTGKGQSEKNPSKKPPTGTPGQDA